MSETKGDRNGQGTEFRPVSACLMTATYPDAEIGSSLVTDLPRRFLEAFL
jgi:hypothetical protein